MDMIQQENPETTLNHNIARELIWRRNSPYFYQTIYTQQLEWPSLTVEWWFTQEKEQKKSSNDESNLCFITYGTHTSGQDKNYLVLAKVYLPNQNYLRKTLKEKNLKATETIRKNDDKMQDKITVLHQIEHEGQINKIKHHPKRTNLLATRTPLGEIHIFDKMKFHTSKKIKIAPHLILSGHQTQGYSIEWNPHREGYIIAGSYDGKLTLWDINTRSDSQKIQPLSYFNYHDKEIEDLSHNVFHDCIFASCDDDGQTVLWDTRHVNSPVHHMKADNSPLYTVQFSPNNRHIFATGGSDKLIKIWDVRNLSEEVIRCEQEGDKDITQLKWSNSDGNILWSVCGQQIGMWDLNQGKKKFIHAGHMQSINQMDVHPTEPNTIASVDNANDIHVFQPTPNAFN